MVLEESSKYAEIFAPDDAPPSDDNESVGAIRLVSMYPTIPRTFTDASMTLNTDGFQIYYRVNGGSRRHYQIPFDRIPARGFTHRMAFATPASAALTSSSLIGLASGVETETGRPPTQTEAESLALRVCEKRLYNAAGGYGGLLVGLYVAFKKRKIFKFPLRKPKPIERYNSFPFQRFALLKGPYARGAWHTVRGLTYMSLSLLWMVPFWGYMGQTVQAVKMMRDDRTKVLAQELKRGAQSRKEAGHRGRVMPSDDTGNPRPSASNQPDSKSTHYGDYDGASQSGYMQDDNSPTSPQDPYSDTSSGVLSDANVQPRNTFDQGSVDRQPRSLGSDYNNPQNDSASSSSSSSSLFFDEDEASSASSAAGNDPHSPSSNPSSFSSSTSGGSAWSRVRQSANASSSPHTPRDPYNTRADPANKHGIPPPGKRAQSPRSRQLQQKSAKDEYGSSADRSSFGTQDQDRQLAKGQAQKEFDRMVEAERGEGGRDGGTAGGSGSAWGQRRTG